MEKALKVLVIEDDYFISKNICDILVTEGYEVLNGVCTVNEAIRKIEEQKPNLVLIDICLKQGEDGTKIGSYLNLNCKTPFIYVSSRTDEVTLNKVKSTNPFGYVVKPFKTTDFKITISLVLNNFYSKLQTNSSDEFSSDDSISFRIKKVMEHINVNVAEKIDIDNLSELTKWKTHHFIRMFHKEVGMTPYQYILKVKIDRACQLIDIDNSALVDVAYDLGFQNYLAFWRSFKKFKKVSPDEYRLMKHGVFANT